MDNKLYFDAHINLLGSRFSFSLSKFYSLSVYMTIKIKIRVVKALIISFIIYAPEIYSSTNTSKLGKLGLLSNRTVRYLFTLRQCDHISCYVLRFLGESSVNFIKITLFLNLYNIVLRQEPKDLFNLFSFSRPVRNILLLIPPVTCSLAKSFQIGVMKANNFLSRELHQFRCSY